MGIPNKLTKGGKIAVNFSKPSYTGQTPRNETSEIPAVYFGKSRVYIHITWSCEFANKQVLTGSISSQS